MLLLPERRHRPAHREATCTPQWEPQLWRPVILHCCAGPPACGESSIALSLFSVNTSATQYSFVQETTKIRLFFNEDLKVCTSYLQNSMPDKLLTAVLYHPPSAPAIKHDTQLQKALILMFLSSEVYTFLSTKVS